MLKRIFLLSLLAFSTVAFAQATATYKNTAARFQMSYPKAWTARENVMGTTVFVALVTACERVPKADKLLNLTLSLGTETRTVLSGIAEHYAPEAVVGKRVVVVSNLAPRKMRGIDSQGMILAGDGENGAVVLLEPDASLPLGARIR